MTLYLMITKIATLVYFRENLRLSLKLLESQGQSQTTDLHLIISRLMSYEPFACLIITKLYTMVVT